VNHRVLAATPGFLPCGVRLWRAFLMVHYEFA